MLYNISKQGKSRESERSSAVAYGSVGAWEPGATASGHREILGNHKNGPKWSCGNGWETV